MTIYMKLRDSGIILASEKCTLSTLQKFCRLATKVQLVVLPIQ